MIDNMRIRENIPDDAAALERLYSATFPDEDLLPLVSDLLDEEPSILSLVAIVDGVPVGHACFTGCAIAGTTNRAMLLGPVAVAPAFHGQGIGSALIRDGFTRLRNANVIQVFVLGDPAYYGRFGFMPSTDVLPPYTLPKEWRGAWQFVSLSYPGEQLYGILSVPPAMVPTGALGPVKSR